MADPFRDRDEALERRIEALEIERDELRRELEAVRKGAAPLPPPEARAPGRGRPVLIALGLAVSMVAAVAMFAVRTKPTPLRLAPAPLVPTPPPALTVREDLGLSLLAPPTDADLHAVWSDGRDSCVAGADGALAVGNVVVAMAKRSLFTTRDAGTGVTLRALTAERPLVAVGDRGTVVEVDLSGASRPPVQVAKVDLLGVARAGRYVVAVGRRGTILRFAAEWGEWRSMESGTTQDLHGVAASPDGEALTAVGDQGVALTFRVGGPLPSEAWSKEATGTEAGLNAVVASDEGMIAVGGGGVIVRRTAGGSWVREESGVSAALNGVARTKLGESHVVIAVGQAGTAVVRDRTGRWVSHRLLSREDLLAVQGRPLIVVGARGTVLGGAGFWLGAQ